MILYIPKLLNVLIKFCHHTIQTSDVVMDSNTVIVGKVTCVREVYTCTAMSKPEVVSVLSEPVYINFRYMPDYSKPETLYESPLSIKAEFSICNDLGYTIMFSLARLPV